MTVVFVTGMSGTGKSTALAELARRGYAVVDTDDDGWSEWVDGVVGSERIWREDRIDELLSAAPKEPLFLSGCVGNQGRFYDRFDAVVLLSAPVDVLLDGIARRTTNDFGKKPDELGRILQDLVAIEPKLRATCTHEIPTTSSLPDVVDELVAIGEGA